MRKINDVVLFIDFAGQQKEGTIIEIIQDKYKIKATNGIKWTVAEEKILTPIVEEVENNTLQRDEVESLPKVLEEIFIIKEEETIPKIEYLISEEAMNFCIKQRQYEEEMSQDINYIRTIFPDDLNDAVNGVISVAETNKSEYYEVFNKDTVYEPINTKIQELCDDYEKEIDLCSKKIKEVKETFIKDEEMTTEQKIINLYVNVTRSRKEIKNLMQTDYNLVNKVLNNYERNARK